MKNYKWLLLLLLGCVPFQSARSQVHSELAMPPNGNNQRSEISQWIGLVKISIDYHSPNVHGGGGAASRIRASDRRTPRRGAWARTKPQQSRSRSM